MDALPVPASSASTDLTLDRAPGPPRDLVWFVWQAGPRGPVHTLVYGEPPIANPDRPRILAKHELSDVLLALVHDEPHPPWGALIRAYPAPAPERIA